MGLTIFFKFYFSTFCGGGRAAIPSVCVFLQKYCAKPFCYWYSQTYLVRINVKMKSVSPPSNNHQCGEVEVERTCQAPAALEAKSIPVCCYFNTHTHSFFLSNLVFLLAQAVSILPLFCWIALIWLYFIEPQLTFEQWGIKIFFDTRAKGAVTSKA